MTVDLDALEQLLAKATPGPWHVSAGWPASNDGTMLFSLNGPVAHSDWENWGYTNKADIELAAALHNAAPAMIAELKSLRALLIEWRETELDYMDEEYQPWLDSFTARVNKALSGNKS
jgi:methionine synthase II (cobalamin-independent)